VKIHSNSTTGFKKYPQVSDEELGRILNIRTSSHCYPRILVNQPEENPNFVEGEEESESLRVAIKAEFELCRLRCSSVPKQEGRVNRDLLSVRLMMVRCMECDSRNDISVIQSNYSVLGSCHNCSARILGRLTDVWLSE
jgi:hypothetical protein